jgi:hypothetical protein
MELRLINRIKIGSSDYRNLWTYEQYDDSGVVRYNIPEDLGEFRVIAIDTLNWLIGKNVLKVAGGKAIDVGTANSKLGVLLVKAVLQLGVDTTQFTELEQETIRDCDALYDAGYSDSEKLRDTVATLLPTISTFTERIARVSQATSHEEIIDILNE